MRVAGVEEAGRGPVIGPLVMAICSIDEEKIAELQRLGVKDSKLITPKNRELLYHKVQEMCESEIIIMTAKDVDDALNNPEMNLNKLEGTVSANLINKVHAEKVILDCPSNNILAYTNYVKSMVKKDIKIISEHKADLNHTIVGAASILAKVTRDRIIDEIKKEVGYDFGSGYPSDPKTIAFLKLNWNKYDIFRKTWATYKKVAETTGQKKLGEY
ncbi:MAG: ribonuclease HII [Candidatus Woesearchaeota archaeon]